MNTINITVELCAEDRARLDKILDLLEKDYKDAAVAVRDATIYSIDPAGELRATSKTAQAPTEETKPEPVEPVTPAEEGQLEGQLGLFEAETPAVKLTDVQQKVVALSAAGKKDAVRDIIKAYADRVSAIPEDKLAEVLDKLNGLEG